MAIHGTFDLNGAEYAPLTFPGIGTFMAFSGNGKNRNHAACTHIPTNGPIPVGKYWIVDRPEGGLISQSISTSKDLFNKMFRHAEFGHSDWFALWRDDMSIDDYTWINSVKRGNFRLHPGTISEGCVTMYRNSDFAVIRNILLKTPLINVPCMRNLKARGTIEVRNSDYAKTCPSNS
ncbi:DUF2778 domain-containing protein [Pantoea ananatis]|uniref:DUF2778 domain-containing protein n=1 Tax=Pantoea ananas TaxID=553 RepID=UPI002079CE1C|nr:DUF2778 domain-containing protein [Pantoea ananatis]USL56775.1 DUF2778 domain-containing protein [Pantoea ananatis]